MNERARAAQSGGSFELTNPEPGILQAGCRSTILALDQSEFDCARCARELGQAVFVMFSEISLQLTISHSPVQVFSNPSDHLDSDIRVVINYP